MPCLTVFGKRSRISPAIDSRSLSPDCLRRNRVRTDCPWWGVSTISHRRLPDTTRYSRKRVFIAPRPQADGSWRTLRPAREMDLLSDLAISLSRINRFGGRGFPLCDRRRDGISATTRTIQNRRPPRLSGGRHLQYQHLISGSNRVKIPTTEASRL